MGAKAGVDEELLLRARLGTFKEEDAGGKVIDVRDTESREGRVEFGGDDLDVERRVSLLHAHGQGRDLWQG